MFLSLIIIDRYEILMNLWADGVHFYLNQRH